MHLGKTVRLERIFNRETKRTIIVPMDHGVSVGPMEGIIDMREATSDMAEGGADAVLMHKGLVRCVIALPGQGCRAHRASFRINLSYSSDEYKDSGRFGGRSHPAWG